jgi:diadenosine tetraphosphatase ApaH/serine/threonine PP2A family protein phosphatase
MWLRWPTIAGNHERQVLDPAIDRMNASDRHAAERLTERHRAWLGGLPPQLRLTHEILCCHGTPSSDLHYLMETLVEAAPGLRAATADEVTQRLGDAMLGIRHAVVLCGHSHLQRVLRLPDGRLVVNPGSVGLQAYDDDHPLPHVVENRSAHARYALLTLRAGGWKVDLHAVPYDWEKAAGQAECNGRPDWAWSLESGLADTPKTR